MGEKCYLVATPESREQNQFCHVNQTKEYEVRGKQNNLNFVNLLSHDITHFIDVLLSHNSYPGNTCQNMDQFTEGNDRTVSYLTLQQMRDTLKILFDLPRCGQG